MLLVEQDVFNKAWKEFIEKEAPPAVARRSGDVYCCRYRTEDGRACAIGLSIPDELARHLEGKGAGSLCRVEVLEALGFAHYVQPVKSEDWLYDLQYSLHDALIDSSTGQWRVNVSERREAYESYAKRWGLTIPLGFFPDDL